MKITVAGCLFSLFVFSASMRSSMYVLAQEFSAPDIDQLKVQVNSQQKLLEKQQARIDALERALAEQQRTLVNVVPGKAQKAMLVPAVASSDTDLQSESSGVLTQDSPAPRQEQQPLSPEAQKVQNELQRGPEIADVKPDTPALNLGPAKIRLIGYAAFTGLYRTTNSGGMLELASPTYPLTTPCLATPANSGFPLKAPG
jgi:hypothetical protein